MTSAEPRESVGLADVLSALPDFGIAATFLITWIRPLAFGFLYFSAWGISELYAHRWAASGVPPHN